MFSRIRDVQKRPSCPNTQLRRQESFDHWEAGEEWRGGQLTHWRQTQRNTMRHISADQNYVAKWRCDGQTKPAEIHYKIEGWVSGGQQQEKRNQKLQQTPDRIWKCGGFETTNTLIQTFFLFFTVANQMSPSF